MTWRAVEAEPLAGTDAALGPDPQTGAGHRGLPQLQVAGDGNVVWNVDGRLVGRALLGCGEVLLVAAAVVAAGVQAVQVVAGVDVGVQQVVVVVAAAVQVGRGGGGQGGHADQAVLAAVVLRAVGAAAASR